jgi:hypothetical protein
MKSAPRSKKITIARRYFAALLPSLLPPRSSLPRISTFRSGKRHREVQKKTYYKVIAEASACLEALTSPHLTLPILSKV